MCAASSNLAQPHLNPPPQLLGVRIRIRRGSLRLPQLQLARRLRDLLDEDRLLEPLDLGHFERVHARERGERERKRVEAQRGDPDVERQVRHMLHELQARARHHVGKVLRLRQPARDAARLLPVHDVDAGLQVASLDAAHLDLRRGLGHVANLHRDLRARFHQPLAHARAQTPARHLHTQARPDFRRARDRPDSADRRCDVAGERRPGCC
mmetsp:Transcript_51792/g.121607  ORF Transcript_51792/g.121607 Transcript_51792/m.121607 type:complete len:210 (+) Transcript_51792:126-755(+)